MATTVPLSFREFLVRIEPTPAQKENHSTKQSGVRDCLADSLAINTSFLTGSYARQTMIRPPADVDLFVVLDADSHADEFFRRYDGAQRVLDRFRRRLKYCYGDTTVGRDPPAVYLIFSNIVLEVVPAFHRQGGGFWIPKPDASGWFATDPSVHATQTTRLNMATGGRFVPTVKMVKAWSRAHYNRLTGFHIECLLAESWPRVRSAEYPHAEVPKTYDNYSLCLADLLKGLASRIRYHTTDPARLSGNIDEYLFWQDRELTRQRLERSAENAATALYHEGRGTDWLAVDRWRDALGDPFPAYG